MRRIVLVVHDIRSTHNVGSILRSADGFGVTHVYLTGYTPYPMKDGDTRLPHISAKVSSRIHKTSLNAESSVAWSHTEDIFELIEFLHRDYLLVGLEQTLNSTPLPKFKSTQDIALFVGNEVNGLPEEVLSKLDSYLEIPMFGQKESFNVSVATAVALYHLRTLGTT